MKTTRLNHIIAVAGICFLAFGCPSAQKPGAPAITSVAPTSVVNNVNTSITITGSGFLNGLTVQIGAQGAIVNSVNSTTIIATVVAGLPAGTYDLTVTNIDGQKATKTGALTVTVPAPTVGGVSPSVGVNNAYTSIAIFGSGFLAGASAKVGATSCSVTTVGSTSISAIVPTGIAAGTYDVSVTNSDNQTGTLSSAFTVRNPAPQVTGINPTTGRQTLTTSVTITGNYFQTGATVSIGAASCGSVSVPNSTTITCTVPSGMGAGVYSVTVTNSDSQSGSLSNAFTIVAPPAVSGVSPSYGGVTLTTPVTISGGGFQAGLAVTIGASTLCTNIVFVNSSVVQCVVPTMPAGVYAVSVTNSDSQSGSLSNAFIVYASPTVSGVSPTTATNNQNTSVVISGSNFRAGATVTMSAGASSYIIQVNSVSSGSINALVLSGAPAGSYTIYVTNIEGQTGASLAGALIVRNPAPQVTGITPTFGVAGTGVTITGVNFTTSGATTVTIGGVACSGVVVNSTTSLTCTVGALGVGTYTVTVTNPDSQSGSLSNAFRVNSPPTVSSITPTAGPNNSNVPVTITGSGFLTGASARLGSTALSGTTVNGSTSISAVVPSLIPPGIYNVTVTNPDGQSATCACTYSAYQGPWISGLSPTQGTVGNTVTISGMNFGSSQGSSIVTVNGIPATVLSWGDTSIQISIPSNASCGPVFVTVSGVVSNPVEFGVIPQITLIYPPTASVNNLLLIAGVGFNNSPGLNKVMMNGVFAASVTGSASTYMITNQPVAAVGISVVTQITNLACNLSSNPLTYSTVAPGTVSPFFAGAYGPWGLIQATQNRSYFTSRFNHSLLKVINNPADPAHPYFQTFVPPNQLNQPTGVAVNSKGNVLVTNGGVAGSNANSLVHINIDPLTQLVAGSTVSLSGLLSQPEGLTIDQADTLYIANAGSGNISRRSAGGTFTSAWVPGLSTPRGLAHNGRYLYATSSGNNTVFKINPNNGSIVRSETGFSSPSGISFRQDECIGYVANNSGNSISLLWPLGGTSQYVPGNNGDNLNNPVGVGSDGLGNLTVLNNNTGGTVSSSVAAIFSRNTPTLTNFSALAGGTFTCPRDMGADALGNTYVVERCPGAGSPPSMWPVIMIPAGGARRALFITGTNFVHSVTADSGNPPNLFVTSKSSQFTSGPSTVVRYTLWGGASVWSSGPSGGGTCGAPYCNLRGAEVDAAGNLYVLDFSAGQIFSIPPGGGLGTLLVNLPSGGYCYPTMTYNKADGNLYVNDTCNQLIVRVNTLSGATGNLASVSRNNWWGYPYMSSDECGNIWLPVNSRDEIDRVSLNGSVATVVPTAAGIIAPYAVSFSASTTGGLGKGGMFYMDRGFGVNQPRRVDFTASFAMFGRGPVESAQGLAVGSDGNLYVSNARSIVGAPDSIESINPFADLSSTFTTSGLLSYPTGLVMGQDKNLYVSSMGNGSIVKVTPSGIQSVFGTPFSFCQVMGLAMFNGAFDLFAADACTGILSSYNSSGTQTSNVFTGNIIDYLAFDKNGNLYMSSYSCCSGAVIFRRLPNGTIGSFITDTNNASGVAVDIPSTYLYFARSTNTIYRAAIPSGSSAQFVPVIAGSLLNLSNPQGLVVDGLNSLYVANYGNNTIYRIAP